MVRFITLFHTFNIKIDREFRIGNIRCSIAGKPLARESVCRRKLHGEYKMNIDYYEHKGE